ncbi:MAG: glycosyltransferase [Candidatus Omnitrophica bacterium]|nr:glycosyltransferase [Candidatus Omnitrophota bacterium]MDD5591980.1 glycosyltransferase [Candidatus Omnitrophota bacterium]
MTVSIIIPVKTWQSNLEECIQRCRELDYSNFEILVFPDEAGAVLASSNILNTKGAVPVRIVPSGRATPAQKRDMAIGHAEGEIFAFIDDDAYPRKDWLKNAVINFEDPQVGAVGGPAITPQEDTLRQRASGMVYSSFLVSANFTYRYLPKKRREVNDYPSCNFLVRKSVMQELGGFKTNFWPGEDTKFCLDIIQKLGRKIIYDPDVLVYHHRRPLFLAHLKQVASYALHRGYFVKKYPQTSFKLAYFVPSLFLLYVLSGGILACFLAPLRTTYIFILILYLSLAFVFSISNELRMLPLVFSGIILTHLTYGFNFLKGLLSIRLREE